MATVEPVRGGWAVRFENRARRRTGVMSKRAALACTWISWRPHARRPGRLRRARRAARIAALLASRGIGEVDYRELQPGRPVHLAAGNLPENGHRGQAL